MGLDKNFVRWGEFGSPLLPETLRQAWTHVRLPAWMVKDLRLPVHATFAYLDWNVWLATSEIPDRVFRAITTFVTQRKEQIQGIRCVQSPWPLGLKPDSVPWARRTRNALVKANLYRPDQINTNITFGQILAIPGAGVMSALDFASTLEIAIRQFDEVESVAVAVLDPAAQESALVKAAEQDWAAQVSGDDPRFRLLLRTIHGMSFREYVHQLLESSDVTSEAPMIAELVSRLDDVENQVRRIKRLNLEDALSDLLGQIIPEQKRRSVLAKRLGWSGRALSTLEAAGQELGLTRERIRQMQSRVLKRLPNAHPVFLPAVDAALTALAELAPIADKAATALMIERGYSNVGFHPAALIATADALGHEHALQRSRVKGTYFVATTNVDGQVRALAVTARRLAGASGAFSVFHARRECAKLAIDLDEERIRNLLGTIPGFVSLDSDRDWWRAIGLPDGRDRLVNLSKKMLSVASPLSVKTIRDGVARAYRGRASSNSHLRDSLAVPPVSQLRSFFEHDAEFSVDGDFVSCRSPLDYKDQLGAGERVVVDVLRSCANGVLDRSALARGALERGLGEASFGAVTSFSPVLERASIAVWKIRGIRVDPSAVEAVQQRVRDVPRNRRVMNYGWTTDGKIWIAVKTPHPPKTMVVGIPSPLMDFIGDRSFNAFLDDGSPCGALTSKEQGTLYGFYTFARAVGLDEGDVVRMTFDLTASTVTLDIVDEEALEE